MKQGELDALKNELSQIYDNSINVINQKGFLDNNQIPKGKNVYNIEASMMFIDIRNSTVLTDSIGRKNMVKIYQMYTKLCREAIHKYDGIVLKIVGDGILCAFTNDDTGNSGQRAVEAAITIHTYIAKSMNPILNPEWRISCGIGIRTGHVYVTRLSVDNGSETAYPSDITNHASKFCNIAKKEEIIFDAKTYEHLSTKFKGYASLYNVDLGQTYLIMEAIWVIN